MAAQDASLHVIVLARNRGKGAAVLHGKIVDILLPSMSVLSVLTSNSIPVSSARSEQNTLSLKRALPPVKRNNVKLKVVTDSNSNNDDDDDGYKNDDYSEVNQRKAAVKKIKLKSLRPSPKRRLSQPQSMRKNVDYREQCRSIELEKVPVIKNMYVLPPLPTTNETLP